tara:strand:+ start:86 stop:484 length:399 start_codon:yes stop_codon:yes gene_type:complete
MTYEIRYIESAIDVVTDSKLLDMLLETDKTTLTKLSNKCMCEYTRIDDDGRAYIKNRGDYAYTFKTVECDNFAEVFEKCNKILHKGARIQEKETGVEMIVMEQGMQKRNAEIEYWEASYKTRNYGEFLTMEH